MKPTAFAVLLGLAASNARELCVAAGLPTAGEQDTRTMLRAAVESLRLKKERGVNPEARNRQQMADAETAEIKAADARNELMLRADGIGMWKDGLTQFRQIIAAADYLTPAQRTRLVKDIKGVQVEEPEG